MFSFYLNNIQMVNYNGNLKKTLRVLRTRIDTAIRNMSYGQSNGIPQGSVLMDFIAEIVLGYADLELSRSIEKYNIEQHQEQNKIQEYKIIRYRDDYRIFANSQNDVVKIAKLLTEVLQQLNLKINTQKTPVWLIWQDTSLTSQEKNPAANATTAE